MAPTMDTFVLVRPMPRVGAASAEEVKALAQKSNNAIAACHAKHGEEHHIKWVTSYVTDDVLVCVYKASDEHVLRVRARCCAARGNLGRRVLTRRAALERTGARGAVRHAGRRHPGGAPRGVAVDGQRADCCRVAALGVGAP